MPKNDSSTRPMVAPTTAMTERPKVTRTRTAAAAGGVRDAAAAASALPHLVELHIY